MEINRRSFVKAAAATAGAAALGSTPLAYAEETSAVESVPEEKASSGKWVMSSCFGCTSFCPVRVYVKDGRAVKVEGNPNSKANHGVVCSSALLALQQQYDPDRLKTPMKRTNPEKGKGIDPGFVPISWDEAMEEICDKLLELRKNGEGHKFVFLKGRSTGISDVFYKAFPEIYGTPNHSGHSPLCAEVEKFASGVMCGSWDYHDYDLNHTKYVVMWGTDPLSMNRQIGNTISAFDTMQSNATIVCIDPRLSSTAAKADKWLPIIPGTDGALASAMAHVILKEGLWNKEFVGDFKDGINYFAQGKPLTEELWRSYGKYRDEMHIFPDGYSSSDEFWFEELKTHGICRWWNLELHDKTPEWAAEITGIDAETITEIARGFATQKNKAISWVSRGVSMTPRGSYTCMACFALNGLVGSYEAEGGLLRSNTAKTGSLADMYVYKDSKAKSALKKCKVDQRQNIEFFSIKEGKYNNQYNTGRLADAILEEDPYEVKALMTYWNNFAYSCPGAQRWQQALEKVPFFVNITTTVSESTMYADIVLPAKHHMFEAPGFVKNKQNMYTYLSLAQEMVKNPFEAKNDETEIAWMLAEKFKEKGFSKLYDYYSIECASPYDGNRPTNAKEFGEAVVKRYTQPAWDPTAAAGGDDLKKWSDFTKNGVWNSDRVTYKKHYSDFGTETGKFEFYSETLREILLKYANLHKTDVNNLMEIGNYQARDGLAFVPHYEEPYRLGDESKYPFLFVDHRSRLNREGRSANTTWYQEFKDSDPGDEPWDDVLKINPKDMDKLGLKDGDDITVASISGEITVHAKGWEGTRPGVVVKCYGQGHWAGGHVSSLDFKTATPRGGNNNEILPIEYDHLTSCVSYHGGYARVSVKKARG